MTALRKTNPAWAIKIVGSPLDGHRAHFQGVRPSPHTLLFDSRAEARAWVAEFKKKAAWTLTGPWAEHGGTRIYRSVSPAKVTVTVSE